MEFSVAIGEPIAPTKNFQVNEINVFSLYSAATLGIDTDEILLIFENISRIFFKKYISDNAGAYGIAHIILKNNRYFIKWKNKKILDEILKQEIIYTMNF